MPTVVDVANLAGVSVATVSRVIQNSNRVSDEKRQRVLEAIEQLGYKTDANNVTRVRRKTILLACGSCQDEFIDSVYEAASEYGYEIAVYYTAGHSLKMNSFMRRLVKNKTVSGVITYGLPPSSGEALAEIDPLIPVVQCCDECPMPNIFLVSSDDKAMGEDAVRHLVSRGYKRIGFIGVGKMRHTFAYTKNREMGYRDAVRELGLPDEPGLVVQCDFSPESVELAVDKLLSLEVPPDAVFCVRDSTATQVVNCLTRRGVKVPEQMAILGCGSVETAERCWLPLSNVTHSYYEIGLEAMTLMHSRLTGKSTLGRRTNISHQVVDRATD